MKLISPRAESWEPGAKVVASQWTGDLEGKTVALIDDARPNADVTVAAIGDQLKQQYGAKLINIDKRPLGVTAPAEALPRDMVDKLCKEADAVIVALAS